MQVLLKTLWVIWLVFIWFASLVATDVTFNEGGFKYQAFLLGAFWLIYLAGLWFEKKRAAATSMAMLLGFAIGMIRMLDRLPNQQLYAEWLRYLPKFLVGGIAIAFICIFVILLPMGAAKIIENHKAKNRVLGRDY